MTFLDLECDDNVWCEYDLEYHYNISLISGFFRKERLLSMHNVVVLYLKMCGEEKSGHERQRGSPAWYGMNEYAVCRNVEFKFPSLV